MLYCTTTTTTTTPRLWLEVIWSKSSNEACERYELKPGVVVERMQGQLEQFEVFRAPWPAGDNTPFQYCHNTSFQYYHTHLSMWYHPNEYLFQYYFMSPIYTYTYTYFFINIQTLTYKHKHLLTFFVYVHIIIIIIIIIEQKTNENG